MEPIRVEVFDWRGRPLYELPYSSCDWSESIGEAGTMQVQVRYSDRAVGVPGGLWSGLRPWRAILAAVRGSDVVHAGWLTSCRWDAASATLDLSCGGGWTVLSRRLVLNHALDGQWRDGDVLIDEEHPAGAWLLTLTGSYRDIASGLVAEAMKWGSLPFVLPARDGGAHVRQYAGYDLASVADRLEELVRLEDGDEIRMDPRLDEHGVLSWLLRSEREIVDHDYTASGSGMLNAAVPGSRVMVTGLTGDGAGMTGQVYATGGKTGDKTLICRAGSGIPDMPLLQSKDTEHTTVVSLGTLKGHVRGDLAYGAAPDETITLRVGQEMPLRPGDHADVQVSDLYLGERLLRLKVTDVQGSTGSDWQDVQARERL